MKRFFWMTAIFISAFAAAVSCQKEIGENEDGIAKEAVSLTIVTPEAVQTRAISDGTTVNWVYWAAFDDSGNPISELNGKEPVKDRTASLEVQLVKDYPYSFVFWAQYENAEGNQPAYDLASFVSEGKVVINYDGAANDECRDAFYKAEIIQITDAVKTRTIELRRPFAQINFLAADYQSVEEVEVHQSLKSTVEISGLPNVLNGLDGTVEGDVSTLFTAAPVPVDPAYYTVNGETYGWYSMNYVLAAEEKELKTVTATFTHDKSSLPVDVAVDNVPYQRNHRTNIIGNFLTEMAEVSVIVIESFDKPDYDIDDEGNPLI